MDIQLRYFESIPIIDLPAISDSDYQKTTSKIQSRRECIKLYIEYFRYHKPCLLDSLIQIYFHPEISILLSLLQGMSTYIRKYHIILKTILDRQRHAQFPFGDIHSQLVTDFLQEVVLSKRISQLTFAPRTNPFNESPR